MSIDAWVEETVSGAKKIADRAIGELLTKMRAEDILIVSELSRLGRNLMDVMGVLHGCMKKNIKVFTIKENYELGNNINSKVLAFAFSLSGEIERSLISQRTKEALARKKSEGKRLGRPKGSLSQKTKLSGKEKEIKELLDKKISLSAIRRIMEVDRKTVARFAEARKLR